MKQKTHNDFFYELRVLLRKHVTPKIMEEEFKPVIANLKKSFDVLNSKPEANTTKAKTISNHNKGFGIRSRTKLY